MRVRDRSNKSLQTVISMQKFQIPYTPKEAMALFKGPVELVMDVQEVLWAQETQRDNHNAVCTRVCFRARADDD